ncbi:hypothetical protein ACWD6K_14090 [Streptomyces sp. NPDC002431]
MRKLTGNLVALVLTAFVLAASTAAITHPDAPQGGAHQVLADNGGPTGITPSPGA